MARARFEPVTQPSIRVLDETTASRIAAGEVVERPYSVVKELVENALDAGARRIDVRFSQGGRRLVQVRDDGHGIRAAEVELALTRHATSKITRAEDLTSVRTLGFRGEALASIAAVSQMTLVTRHQDDDFGVEARVDSGRLISVTPAGAPTGTSVTVENLFHAVPARLKFLNQDSTEAGRIIDVVTRLALSRPDVRFTVDRDGRNVLRTAGDGSLDQGLGALLGSDVARELLPIGSGAGSGRSADTLEVLAAGHSGQGAVTPQESVTRQRERGAVAVWGFVSPPHVHRSRRNSIYIMVNSRPVADSSLTFAVVQAYHTLLPKGRAPIAVVMLDIDPEMVDVNVHPAKTEVRFRDPRAIFGAVQASVRRALVDQSPIPPLEGSAAMGGLRRVTGVAPSRGVSESPGDFDFSSGDRHRARTSDQNGRPGEQSQSDRAGDIWPRTDVGAAGEAVSGNLPALRPLGQVGAAFIVCEGPDGLYLIDQHAAHERVLYEQLLRRAAADGVPSQRLLEPEALQVSAADVALVEDRIDAARQLGFELEPFGTDTVLLRSLPEVVSGVNPREVVTDLLAALEESAELEGPVDRAVHERVASRVCKSVSVKAGQILDPGEMRRLIEDLERTVSPRTCPHGRPTLTVIPFEQLRSGFGRH